MRARIGNRVRALVSTDQDRTTWVVALWNELDWAMLSTGPGAPSLTLSWCYGRDAALRSLQWWTGREGHTLEFAYYCILSAPGNGNRIELLHRMSAKSLTYGSVSKATGAGCYLCLVPDVKQHGAVAMLMQLQGFPALSAHRRMKKVSRMNKTCIDWVPMTGSISERP